MAIAPPSSDFIDWCKNFGVISSGLPPKPVSYGVACDLLCAAQRIFALETIGFYMCARYYMGNPASEARLASIKSVFLVEIKVGGFNQDAAGRFAVNLPASVFRQMAGGYSNAVALFDTVSFGLGTAFKNELKRKLDAALANTKTPPRGADAIKQTRVLRDDLKAAGGWDDTDLQKMGFF